MGEGVDELTHGGFNPFKGLAGLQQVVEYHHGIHRIGGVKHVRILLVQLFARFALHQPGGVGI